MLKQIIVFSIGCAATFVLADTPRQLDFTEVQPYEPKEYLEFIQYSCSMHCYMDWQTSAVSTLSAQGSNSYRPENLFDANLSTAWVEGQKDDGVGSEFILAFTESVSPKGIPLTGFELTNGYAKNSGTWAANSRIKQLAVYHNDKWVYTFNLLDTPTPQQIDFDGVPLSAGDELRFRILSVYPGNRYKDTALSELLIYGAH